MAGEGTMTGAAAGTAISPGVGTIIGAGIGAAGDIFGGLFGSSSSKSIARANRREARRQFDQQMNESVQRRVQDALKAGINPLVALGYNGGASPTIHAGGEDNSGAIMANAISNVGSRAQRVIEKLTEEKAVDDINYDNEVKQLDLESRRLENRILRQRADSMTVQPGQDVESSPNMTGEHLLFHPVYDLYGRPRLVINQDVMEMDSDNAGYRSSMAVALKDSLMNGQISKSGRIESPALLDLIDDMYYNTTGHHIANLGELYISPTEMYMVLGDEAKQWLGKMKGGD